MSGEMTVNPPRRGFGRVMGASRGMASRGMASRGMASRGMASRGVAGLPVTRMALAAMAMGVLTGCEEIVPLDLSRPLTIEVTVLEGPLGTSEDPIPLTELVGEGPERIWLEGDYRLGVRVLLADGQVATSFTRPLHVRTLPGKLISSEWVNVSNGQGEVEVSIEKHFGQTRLWIEDIEEGLEASDEPGVEAASYATGVSPQLYMEDPTVGDIQFVTEGDTCRSPNNQVLDAYECAALTNNFVHVRAEDRTLVVTHITTNGFFVTDCTSGMGTATPCDDANGLYNSIFAFSYSAPKNLFVGDVLSALEGNVAEFYGSTQLSFPAWTVAYDLKVAPPTPQVLAEPVYCGDATGMMREAYESDLVEIQDLVIKNDWTDNELSGYSEHGQWPVLFQSGAADAFNGDACSVLVVSDGTVPEFNPLAYPGCQLAAVRGVLGTYSSEYSRYLLWIVQVRGPEDLVFEGENCPAAL